MDTLNYHHLRYFREVAHEGQLSQAAARLNVAQSALSIQIKQLEHRLGHPLFDRVGRRLVLTEAGRITLEYADRIFGTGAELLATLNQRRTARPPLRVGTLSTLSRNFQMQFLQPILQSNEWQIVLRSGNTRGLLEDLQSLALDIVLTTELPPRQGDKRFAAQRIDQQKVGLHGPPARLRHSSLSALLSSEPLILPTDSAIRSGFENLAASLNITPQVVADVDDMAMVRLLARNGVGVAVAPAVVMADEVTQGLLQTAPFDLNISEPFYAVTLPRSFPHPALAALLGSGAGAFCVELDSK